MKSILFKDKSAQKVYDNYIKRIVRTTKSLSQIDQEDVLMEFNSHIYESLQRNSGQAELENLLQSFDALGEPEEVLLPLLADKTLEKATRTFNPFTVFKAIALNIGNGFIYSMFAILYLFLFAFVFLIGAKIIYPKEVGMFFKDGDFLVLGLTNQMNEPNVVDVLGHLFIPVMLACALIMYFLITFALRFRRNKTTNSSIK